jgi:hypothetical protein
MKWHRRFPLVTVIFLLCVAGTLWASVPLLRDATDGLVIGGLLRENPMAAGSAGVDDTIWQASAWITPAICCLLILLFWSRHHERPRPRIARRKREGK